MRLTFKGTPEALRVAILKEINRRIDAAERVHQSADKSGLRKVAEARFQELREVRQFLEWIEIQ